MGGRGNDPERTEELLARLRDRLRAEAERHEPDRERIWARIEAAMDRPNTAVSAGGARLDGSAEGVRAGAGSAALRDALEDGTGADDHGDVRGAARHGGRHAAAPAYGRRQRWLRVGLASLATAGIVGLTSGVFWGFTDGGSDPAVPLAGRSGGLSPSPPPSGEPSRPGGPAPQTDRRTSAPSSPSPSRTASPSRRTPSDSAEPTRRQEKAAFTASGSLDPDSGDHWAQNNVVLRVHEPLRALEVTVRVRRDGNVSPAGSWLSLPNGDFRASTDTTSDAIVYSWTLLPGRTVRPGSYTLAAQYNRTSAHDPRKDAYTVRATMKDGPSSVAEGHF
ncbi:hypothetical protein Arub01_22830 [Actinomadura rubrobrunea]|uniref:Uncharacterized protein n=1 Tax=Actinomadura rubrobrunea TaxID=115335 RepID=A0A9W6UUL3_9ACTN|nr:hypothetical protein [Actinomadura rubrobrunea]GLW64039.1 hypothetical protein Arub01_22830 [Actinomadura rubrobrunea]